MFREGEGTVYAQNTAFALGKFGGIALTDPRLIAFVIDSFIREEMPSFKP